MAKKSIKVTVSQVMAFAPGLEEFYHPDTHLKLTVEMNEGDPWLKVKRPDGWTKFDPDGNMTDYQRTPRSFYGTPGTK